MFNQRAQILQIAVVCIMCLSLAAGVSARSVVRSDDAFPVPGCLYVADGPINFSSIQTEIVSMSLRASSDPAHSISPASLGEGTWAVDSFFDVFTELTIDGQTSNVTLTGPVTLRIVVPPEPSDGTGTFDTEILSMSLIGEIGGVSIEIGYDAASGLPTGKRQVTKLLSGGFAVDSFFDCTYTYGGSQGSTPADGPVRMETTGAQVGEFNVEVAGDSGDWNVIIPSASGGDGWAQPGSGDQWLPYPQPDDPIEDEQVPPNPEVTWVGWWNEWWYDDPYDPDRVKDISFSFDYIRPNDQEIGFAGITVNWSTTDWSINPPTGVNPSQQPPDQDFDPANPSVAWVGRANIGTITLDDTNPSGHYSDSYRLPIPYNPEWVSIDVRGYNFNLANGQITHECIPDPDIPDITIEQLDWPDVSNSAWGRVKVDYNQSPGIYYFNLSIDDGSGAVWVVQNLSIESLGGDQSLMAYLDLGVTDGTDVGSLSDYGYSIDNAPISVGPTMAGNSIVVPGLEFHIGSEGGENVGTPGTPPRPSDKVSYGAGTDPNSGVIPDKDKFVNQPQGKNQCAPGAISNSLKWLQARGKIPATIPTSIGAVGGVIGTTADGTPKTWYIKKKDHYKKYVNTRWIEAPLTVAKIQELVKELKDGQDIEMDLKGHVEVLAGIRINADGTVSLDLYDDNQTDNKSDPMHTSPLCGPAGTDYVDGMELERFVIECPKATIVGIPHFSLNTDLEWGSALSGEYAHASIVPMTQQEGESYLALWQDPQLVENPDEPYPPQAQFMQADQLYPYAGDGDPGAEDPDDGGLVMTWGGDPGGSLPQGSFASAFRVEYSDDPDLSNSIITVAVTAPQFSFVPPYSAITQVSLGLEMPPVGSGIIRSWYWNCGNTGTEPIQWGVPTTITIDTSITSTAAATPTATNYLNVPGFNITNVLSILVDENTTWMGPPTPSPAPGGAPVFMWNYWHWLMISPKTTLTKALLTKHSQGPVIIDTSSGEDPAVPLFWGWDEKSDYHMGPIAADDWLCEDDRPVTDFHWWGSFPGWTDPTPPCHPVAFHIGIWSDTPADPCDVESYSHPKELVWEHICDNYVWNFAGFDRDPRQFPGGTDPGGGIPADDPTSEPNDACFQYNQLLDGDDWFYQDTEGEPNRIYWLSIAPIWDYDCEHDGVLYEWGWKTRPKFFMDNAVSITAVTDTSGATTWPPVLGSLWSAGVPLQIPPYPPHADAISWDLAFEISTNELSYEEDPIPGDISGPAGVPDGKVNFDDLVVIALNWAVVVAVP